MGRKNSSPCLFSSKHSSYDKILRMDHNLVDTVIRSCGDNKVPLPESITSTSIIHASVDNFENRESSKE